MIITREQADNSNRVRNLTAEARDVLEDLGAYNPKWGKYILVSVIEETIGEMQHRMFLDILMYEQFFPKQYWRCAGAKIPW